MKMKVDKLTKIPKVLGAGIATNDGFIIESQFTVGYNADKSAAMAARVVDSIKKSLKVAKASAILYTQNVVFFIKETGEGIFFVICQKDANLGLVKIKIDKIK
jgi:predicted regulator of Ras-like GTPase activity (Roadblock/LC7/MglB family)